MEISEAILELAAAIKREVHFSSYARSDDEVLHDVQQAAIALDNAIAEEIQRCMKRLMAPTA